MILVPADPSAADTVSGISNLSNTLAPSGPATVNRSSSPSRGVRIIAGAAAALAVLAFLSTAQRPGQAIRTDLTAAATRLRLLPANASAERVEAALLEELPGRAVTIDTAGFPAAVRVTLHSIDRSSCVAALRSAVRIEGAVVVELEDYPSSANCAASNDMTWRLMP